MPRHVLVIEDDHAIRRGVVDALRSEGFTVSQAGDAKTGGAMAVEVACDLILLDMVLPGGDGLDILRRLRDARPTLPVIVLTARGETADRVAGLRLGADDYVVKPFNLSELLARVHAVLRRSPARESALPTVEFDGGSFDVALRELRFHDGETASLSQREADVLHYLARHPDRVVSRDELLQNVWGLDPSGIDTRTIDMHIARLREKLRDHPDKPTLLCTIRGKGYVLRARRGGG